MDIHLRRAALCALAFVAMGVGPCNLTKHRADVDADGWVDANDELIVETCIGPPQGTWPICERADVMSNGVVDQRDLDAVRSYLGEVLFTPEPPPFVPTDIELGVGVLYLHAPDEHEIYRWSLASRHWLAPIYVGGQARHLAYSDAHRRLYVAYANGAIRQIDADFPLGSTPFAALRAAPDGLEAAGPYVFASDASGIKGTHYTFAEDGAPISAEEWRWYSSAFAWNDDLGRMYYFQDPVSPNDLLWDAIDPGTGAIVQDGESPYHSDLEIVGPIRVSPDGARVLLGSGDVYAAPDLWLETSLPFGPVDAAWVADGDLLTLSATQEGDTLLRHWSGELALYNLQAYPGSPMRVFAWEAGVFAVLTLVDGSVQIHPYVPTNDADGDSVANDLDAFPLDPAASLDSDGDGFPDAWNHGQGPEDSPSGLQLDAFPYDSACQLLEHAPPGEPCDVAATIPPYVPARIEMDTAGIVYLLSPDNDRVYRWSTSWGTHLNPILVGDAPRHIAYSEENGRLYVGYADGAITQIDVTEPFPKEQAFAAVPGELRGLQTAGRFLYADTRASWGGKEWHRTWAPDGTPISARSHSAYYSAGFTWSAVQGRMYLTTLGLSPLTLRWVGIDPQTGQVAATSGSLAHDLLIQQPIRLSWDESRLLLGSGALFDPGSLAVEGGLLEPIADAVWTAAGLQSVRPDGAGGTFVDEWTQSPTLQNVARLPGTPLRILSHQGVTIVVTRVDGRPVFHFYEPGTDADGDGVAWSEDAFPFDPAASQDSDRDGYPDDWNAGSGPEDSSEGLALDAFPLDMGCQLPEHGGGGVCDAQGILPSSTAEPFCELDELPAQPSGTLSLGTASYWPRTDFVPLCSGWVLRADDRNEQVVVQNLATGRSGARYALPAMPGDLDLDEASKRLYVALPGVPGFAAIDLITGEIQRIQAPGLVYGVAVGPDGGVFVGTTTAVNGVGGHGAKLYWLAPGASSVSGGWTVAGQLMRWNAPREELVVGGYGSGTPSLARYAFDPATGPVVLQTRSPAGSVGYELAVSPDGQHVAYSASPLVGSGAIADLAAGDLSSHLGSWTLGTTTTGVAFEAGGERLIAANNTSIQIFDVATHARLRSFAAPACVYSGWVPKVAFSRGGRLALARQICSQQGSMTERYHWFVAD